MNKHLICIPKQLHSKLRLCMREQCNHGVSAANDEDEVTLIIPRFYAAHNA